MDHGRSRLGHAARWAALAALTAVAAACGGTAPQSTEPPATAPPASTAALRTVTVFFPDAGATELVGELREVPADGAPLRRAIEALAAGPSAPELLAPLPPGTAVLDARLVDGTAEIDLDGAFERGYPSGGAAAEIFTLAPLVYTATAVDGALRARITVEGRVPRLAGSQFDLSRPLTRGDFPDLLGR